MAQSWLFHGQPVLQNSYQLLFPPRLLSNESGCERINTGLCPPSCWSRDQGAAILQRSVSMLLFWWRKPDSPLKTRTAILEG